MVDPADHHVPRHGDLDRTHAVEPLERAPQWDSGELPETYPAGL